MVEPTEGDLILRGSAEAGFSVVDAGTGVMLAGPEPLTRAVEMALGQHASGDCGTSVSMEKVFLLARPC